MWAKLLTLLHPKMLIILVLGFASGLPLGLTMGTLQAWYTVEGVDITTIGFLALVGQPYVYKFMWAPMMDKVVMPWGRRKSWILLCQGALILTVIWMALLNPKEMPLMLGCAALLLAFFSASQDIAIDAYRTEILTPEERGHGAAMSVTGYRIAMLVSGGLALVVADLIGFQMTYIVMGLSVALCMLITFFAKEPKQSVPAPKDFLSACIEPLKEFLTRDKAILLLALVVFYKIGDAFVGSLTITFLLRGVGFSLTEVGFINKTVGLFSTLFGVFACGYLLSRIGLYKSLLWFGIIQAISNLAYLSLAYTGARMDLMVISVFLENFGGGLGTGAFIALLMSLCHTQYTATQYALLSAMSAIGRVFIGPGAGYFVDHFGWIDFFIGSLIFSLPGIVLLMILKQSVEKGVATSKPASEIA